MTFLGFDRLAYPGDAVMQGLRAQGKVSFVACYLAPSPSQGNTSWMAHVSDLIKAGWGLAPVYVGQQAKGGPGSHTLMAAQGTTDAADACALAVKAGLPEGRVIYLDIEVGGTLAADQMSYVSAWVTAMRAAKFAPGIYASTSKTAAQVVAAVGNLPVWVFHPRDNKAAVVDPATEAAPDPTTSGFSGATVWQYRLSLTATSRIDLAWTDSSGKKQVLQSVDMDSSTVADPSLIPSGSSTGAGSGAGSTGSGAGAGLGVGSAGSGSGGSGAGSAGSGAGSGTPAKSGSGAGSGGGGSKGGSDAGNAADNAGQSGTGDDSSSGQVLADAGDTGTDGSTDTGNDSGTTDTSGADTPAGDTGTSDTTGGNETSGSSDDSGSSNKGTSDTGGGDDSGSESSSDGQ